MSKEIVSTDRAPAAVGPYSQAVKCNGLLFVSGQIPLDPDSGVMVAGDIRNQTRRVLENLSAVLTAASSDLSRVVKTTVYLTDMNDFGAVNEVYAEFFTEQPPARACVAVAGLPKDAAVEIEAVATV